MATGHVKFYDVFKSFGSIISDDRMPEIYLYAKVVKQACLDFISPGQRVSYAPKREGTRRLVATNIQLLSP